jgi:hypothetical protein
MSKILDALINAQPTEKELTSVLEIFGTVLLDEKGQESHVLRGILSEDTPVLMELSAPGGMTTIGILATLSSPGGFLSYFYDTIRSDYSIDNLLVDLQRFTRSTEVQSKSSDKNDLFYSVGAILSQFSVLVERGVKAAEVDAYFSDHWNVGDGGSTYFDVFNYFLSSK